MPTTDEALLAAVLAAPADDTPRLVYADWLDERADPRGEYLRAELSAAEGVTDARRRMRQLRPNLPAGWLAQLEQPEVMRAAPVPFPPSWVGTEIPEREHPTELATYTGFGYADLPPLPVERFDGSFRWLADDHGPESPLGPIAEAADAAQLTMPPAFLRFMIHHRLWGQVRSCTDCFFNLPSRLAPCPNDPDGGTLVRFYSDSQGCCHWYLYLQPGGFHCVVCAGGQYGGTYIDPNTTDSQGRPAPARFIERMATAPDEVIPDEQVLYAAPTFEAFVYRTWIENEIWYARLWQETQRPLTADEEAYIAHYRRKAGG